MKVGYWQCWGVLWRQGTGSVGVSVRWGTGSVGVSLKVEYWKGWGVREGGVLSVLRCP